MFHYFHEFDPIFDVNSCDACIDISVEFQDLLLILPQMGEAEECTTGDCGPAALLIARKVLELHT